MARADDRVGAGQPRALPPPSRFRHAPPQWTGSQCSANAGRGIRPACGRRQGSPRARCSGRIGQLKDRGTQRRGVPSGRWGRDDPGQEEAPGRRPAPNRARTGFEVPRVRVRGRRWRPSSATRPLPHASHLDRRCFGQPSAGTATAGGPPRRIIRLYRVGEPPVIRSPTRAGCHIIAGAPSPVAASTTRSTSAGSGHSPCATRRPLTTTP